MLEELLVKATKPDQTLLNKARLDGNYAAMKVHWSDAKKYLTIAETNLSRLKNKKSEALLELGRFAESLTYEKINNLELEKQLNYSKRIYEKENSADDLYNLAKHAESYAFKFENDSYRIQFFNYAKDIFLKLDKTKDIKRLAHTMFISSCSSTNIVLYGYSIKLNSIAKNYEKSKADGNNVSIEKYLDSTVNKFFFYLSSFLKPEYIQTIKKSN